MSEIPGQSGHALPDLRPPVCATRGHGPLLFNHLVGAGAQARRYIDAEGLGGNQIDHEIELGRLLDLQVGGLGAAQDFYLMPSKIFNHGCSPVPTTEPATFDGLFTGRGYHRTLATTTETRPWPSVRSSPRCSHRPSTPPPDARRTRLATITPFWASGWASRKRSPNNRCSPMSYTSRS